MEKKKHRKYTKSFRKNSFKNKPKKKTRRCRYIGGSKNSKNSSSDSFFSAVDYDEDVNKIKKVKNDQKSQDQKNYINKMGEQPNFGKRENVDENERLLLNSYRFDFEELIKTNNTLYDAFEKEQQHLSYFERNKKKKENVDYILNNCFQLLEKINIEHKIYSPANIKSFFEIIFKFYAICCI